MALSWYNGFSPAQREQGNKWVHDAVDSNELVPLSECACHYCGQDEGIRHYHCEDYSTKETVVGGSVPVCWRCHMMIHRRFRHPKSYEKYFEEVKSGKRYPPIYKQNQWQELNQHSID
ncbi:hypothetical protein AGMMS49975_06030 [Clostridia bacterium]|nr:hypothetical protein AGMMS49975_06030 [Clostridia bacterium]